jgi:RNA methyltransferase, TrmH family
VKDAVELPARKSLLFSANYHTHTRRASDLRREPTKSDGDEWRSLTGARRFASLVAMKPAHRKIRLSAGAGSSDAIISSRENRWLKRFRAALHGVDSASDAAIGIEGPHLVEAALGCGADLEAVLISTAGERQLARMESRVPADTPILRTTDRLFDALAATETPQGIAALVRPRQASFDEITLGCPLIVVLAGVQDPGNVGAILRTAEVMGATAAATCAVGGIGTSNPLAPKALRASAGSALRLPLVRAASGATFLLQLRVAGIKSYASCPAAAESTAERSDPTITALRPWEADWKVPVALWIGNEGAGLPAEIARSADARVTIPQSLGESGAVDSLNAAAAAAILLYEAARQRGTLS